METPQATGGDFKPVTSLGKKEDVAKYSGRSVKWVEAQMRQGMPHLRTGYRSVAFDLPEVAAWIKQKYGTQRRAVAA